MLLRHGASPLTKTLPDENAKGGATDGLTAIDVAKNSDIRDLLLQSVHKSHSDDLVEKSVENHLPHDKEEL